MAERSGSAFWRLGRSGLAVFAATALLGLVLGPTPASGASSSKQDVRVTNTAAEPVPVTGNVNVAGTVGLASGTGVAASQAGPWAVGVNSLPAVQLDPAHNGVRVLNADDSPVPVVVKSGQQPFQRYFIMSIQGGQRCETAGISLVPDGTRLTVTSLNFHMYPITGVSVRSWVQAHLANGQFANIHVPYEKQDYHDDVNDRDDYVGTVATSLVHENSYPFFVTICMSQVAPGGPENGLGVFQGSVVGYTEPRTS